MLIFCMVSARDTKIDVVLVDTAGRMQDNEPLMRSLAKVSLLNTRGHQCICVCMYVCMCVCMYVCICLCG